MQNFAETSRLRSSWCGAEELHAGLDGINGFIRTVHRTGFGHSWQWDLPSRACAAPTRRNIELEVHAWRVHVYLARLAACHVNSASSSSTRKAPRRYAAELVPCVEASSADWYSTMRAPSTALSSRQEQYYSSREGARIGDVLAAANQLTCLTSVGMTAWHRVRVTSSSWQIHPVQSKL